MITCPGSVTHYSRPPAGALAVGVFVGQASATPSSGTSSTLLGRGTFAEDFFKLTTKKVVDVAGVPTEYEVNLEAREGLDVAAQRITFDPGGHSGWHSHPGPVFITVRSGTMTFYESDDPTCTPIVRGPNAPEGNTYLDTGEHAHIARNETTAPAENFVVYLAPPAVSLRKDEPRSVYCPASVP